MTKNMTEWQREAIQAINDIADLERRPAAYSQVSACISEIRAVERATLQTIEELLTGIGFVVQRKSLVFPKLQSLRTSLILTEDLNGHLVGLAPKSDTTCLVTSYSENKTVELGWETFLGNRSSVEVLIIEGSHSSFLSSDDSFQRHRSQFVFDDDSVPIKRFRDVWPMMKRIIGMERRDIGVVAVYSVLTSLLGLVLPLSSQAIVNAVALGVFSQQLVVLCIVVFCAMMVIAVASVLERYVIDMIQRRLFVTSAFDIVYKLPRIMARALDDIYAPELVNRFFDVTTVQKSVGKFLLEGFNSVLILLTGLIVLATYHPFFLLYDILFLLFIPVLVFVLGRNAIPTAIIVSKRKYQAAAWIEEVARNQRGFKLTGSSAFTLSRMGEISAGYTDAKRRHFHVLARQIIGSYVFKGVAMVGILALGGVLVLEQSLSLGQLVAAEIIIIMILGAMEKIIGQFDLYYDLIAGLEKLSNIIGQPLETVGGSNVPETEFGGTLSFNGVGYSYGQNNILTDVSFSVKSGEHVSLVGHSGAGKSTLARLILGFDSPSTGFIEVNGVDTRSADLSSLRRRVSYIFPENSIIPGTVLENITLGRLVNDEDLNWAVSMARLDELLRDLPSGLYTQVAASGEMLSFGLRRRILFARMILGKPDVLLIDEAFEGIEDGTKLEMLNDLMKWPHWTIVNITHDPEMVRRTRNVYVLSNGTISESGTPEELYNKMGVFRKLFPDGTHFTGIHMEPSV